MQELFDGQEELKTINVMDLAKQAGLETPEEAPETTEVPSVDEAENQGRENAEQDAELPPTALEEAYSDYKKTLDGFFSIGSNDGFMDQFLLKHQSKKLWELIGVLTKIEAGVEGEKGEDSAGEMQAFNKAKERTSRCSTRRDIRKQKC